MSGFLAYKKHRSNSLRILQTQLYQNSITFDKQNYGSSLQNQRLFFQTLF